MQNAEIKMQNTDFISQSKNKLNSTSNESLDSNSNPSKG